MDNSVRLVNLISLVIGAVTVEAGLKLVNPWHSLYGQFSVIYQHLANFWGIPGNGFLFKMAVGYGKVVSGVGAMTLCWLDSTWSNTLLAVSLSIIITIMSGAVWTQFGRGWEATREPALLLSIAIVSLYLQTFYGMLQETQWTVIFCLMIGASILSYFVYLRGEAVSSEKLSPNGTTVTLLAEGEHADTYYRLA